MRILRVFPQGEGGDVNMPEVYQPKPLATAMPAAATASETTFPVWRKEGIGGGDSENLEYLRARGVAW